MFICPECRSVYMQNYGVCERDQVPLVPVQANQDPRTYPLLNSELDGRYHLIGGLGQGGVGTVYLANHIHLDQLSAVKFLDVDMLGEVDEEQREESLQDFVKEAKLAMMLRHDYVVRVMDYGVHERCPFLVMEYVPGPSLLRRMNAGERFEIKQCVNIISRLAEALSAFHDRKLVHRDLKPANVILDPRDNGELTLVDLGLVKDLSNEARSSTHPLALRGTPGYLAPEQVPSWVLSSAGMEITSEKQPVDARVDVYALGVLAFELLSGQTPYPKGMSPTKVIVHTCTKPTPDLLALYPHIEKACPGLAKLVMSMMAKRPQDRPKDAGAVKTLVDSLVFQEEQVRPHDLSAEIHKATQALVDHIKPTALSAAEKSSKAQHTNQRRASASTSLRTSQGASPSSGFLIPPPNSLIRSGEIEAEAIITSPSEESTLHMEGTIDEESLAHDISLIDDLQEAKTAINSISLRQKYVPPIYDEVLPLDQDYKSESNPQMFWIGVVLISIVVGIFSALLNTSPKPNKQMRIVMGSNISPIKGPSSRKRQGNERADLSKQSNSRQNVIGSDTTFATPRLTLPSRPEQRNSKISKRKGNSAGVVEVKFEEQEEKKYSRSNNRKSATRKSAQSQKVARRSINRPKSRTSKKNNQKHSKPLTKSQYRLLKLQVENLLRNQRVQEARRKLSSVKKRLKPSDQFYLEINMLLDSISH